MFKPRRVKAFSKALTGLFVDRPTVNVTRLNHRDIYYKHYYFPRNLCDLIDIVSWMDRISKKLRPKCRRKPGFQNTWIKKSASSLKANAPRGKWTRNFSDPVSSLSCRNSPRNAACISPHSSSQLSSPSGNLSGSTCSTASLWWYFAWWLIMCQRRAYKKIGISFNDNSL